MSTIRLKRSTTGGNTPALGDLDFGELALNIVDGKLFFKNASNNSVFEFDVTQNYSVDGHGHTVADVTGLQSALDGKSNTGHSHVVADITDIGSYTGFDSRYYTETEVDNLVAGYIPLTQKASANGVASLDANGLIPVTQLPSLSISEVFPVSSETEQLALTAQSGDVAIRSDIEQNFIHNGGSTGTMSDWTALAMPADAVSSVDGRTGTVTLSDLYAPLNHTHSISEITNLQTELDNRSLIGHTHSISDITSLQSSLDGKSNVGHSHAWSEITDKPTTFTPGTHTHSISEVTDFDPSTKADLSGADFTGHVNLTSLNTSGNVIVGDGNNSWLKARHINGKDFDSNDDAALYLNHSNGFPVYINGSEALHTGNIESKNLTWTGSHVVNTDTNNSPFQLSRNNGTESQVLKIGVADTAVRFRYIEDTSTEGTGIFGAYVFTLAGNSGEADLDVVEMFDSKVNIRTTLDMQGNTINNVDDLAFGAGSSVEGTSLGFNVVGGSTSQIAFKTNDNTVRGYVYANTSSQFGFLDSTGSWKLRTEDSRMSLYGSGTGSSNISYLQFLQSDGTRDGYVGSGTSGSRDMFLLADGGHLHLRTPAGFYTRMFYDNVEKLRVSSNSNISYQDIDLQGNELQFVDKITFTNSTTKHLTRNGDRMRWTSQYGYVDIGAGNTSWCHFYTDMPAYYFDTTVCVNGSIRPHSNNTDECGTSTYAWSSVHSYNFDTISGNGYGVRFWNSDTYKIFMASTGYTGLGNVSELSGEGSYNMYFKMGEGTGRGFVFYNDTDSSTAAAQITGTGNVYARTSMRAPTFYENGTSLASKYLGISAKAADSNLLDGLDSSAFIRSNADDNVTGHTEWQDSYQVRLGNSADYRMYHNGSSTYHYNYTGGVYHRQAVHGNYQYFQVEDSGGTNRNVAIFGGSSPYCRLYYNGGERLRTTSSGVTVYGTMNATSDKRLKENIEVYDVKRGASDIVAVDFNWKDKDKSQTRQTGYIAQEVAEVMPEAVHDTDGVLTVNYNAVHTAKIAELESKVERLERLLEAA